jgi:hypothetical protein
VHRFGQGSKKSPSAECPGFVAETWEPISEKLVLIEALVEGLDGPYTYDSMLRIHSMDYPLQEATARLVEALWNTPRPERTGMFGRGRPWRFTLDWVSDSVRRRHSGVG